RLRRSRPSVNRVFGGTPNRHARRVRSPFTANFKLPICNLKFAMRARATSSFDVQCSVFDVSRSFTLTLTLSLEGEGIAQAARCATQ
ncbi:MAG: hypothetical protein N3I86_15440, partial [Verrucomicrobiae bacterium]|nr:hypothetical protein [Verrucomicrobiae bacterium]